MITQQEITSRIGTHLLFLSQDTISWSLDQFKIAAQWAKSHHIDSLILKCADGAEAWYGGLSGYIVIEQVLHDNGVGCIPYAYLYGNKYGAINAEIALIRTFMTHSNIFIADLEQEWNGSNGISYAASYAEGLQGHTGLFMVSTWSDLALQQWNEVARTLAPIVDCWMPQQYNSWLGYDGWKEDNGLGLHNVQPTLNLDQSFGINNQVELARLAHANGATSLSMWSYDLAVSNPSLVDAIITAFPTLSPTSTQPTQGEDDVNMTLKHVVPTNAMTQQAHTVWNANKSITVIENSGIFQIWAQALYNGKGIGMPVSPEYPSNDWNNEPIIRQDFSGGHAEWSTKTNTCRLFVSGIGELVFV